MGRGGRGGGCGRGGGGGRGWGGGGRCLAGMNERVSKEEDRRGDERG